MDLTADIARERDLSIDEGGFERAMDAQRDRARSASQFGMDTRPVENRRATRFQVMKPPAPANHRAAARWPQSGHHAAGSELA